MPLRGYRTGIRKAGAASSRPMERDGNAVRFARKRRATWTPYREDLYFFGGAMGHHRGYNVAMVDLPGQGKAPFAGLYFRHDTERPVAAIIDHLVESGRIDGRGIVLYGISGGGYFACGGI